MNQKEKNLMVTISGGRSSAKAARHIQTSDKYKDYNKLYVFANTGQERTETINFLKHIVKNWGIDLNIVEGVYSNKIGVGIGYKLVDFESMAMNSEPFEGAIMHKNKGVYDGLPHQKAPYCSESMKTIPCKKFADEIFGVNNYIKSIGFRKEDMPKRITVHEIKEDKERIFPLITDFYTPIGQSELTRWWKTQPFKLEIDGKFGNCKYCWKKSEKLLLENIKFDLSNEDYTAINWWQKMEEQYGNVSFRGNKSIDDLVRLSKLPTTLRIEFPDEEQDSCVCSF